MTPMFVIPAKAGMTTICEAIKDDGLVKSAES
jgi:hypothetical protein